ncbi:MAG: AMP-binding protein [Burkholderiales bacterium]
MLYPQPDPERARQYHAAGYWRDVTIAQAIAASTAAAPDKLAVRDAAGASLTYRQLDEQSGRLAGFLAGRGVVAGDIVTICQPNWCQTVVVFAAVLKLGAVINAVPVTYGRAELAFVLGKCQSKALFIAARFRSTDYTANVAALEPALTQNLTIVRLGDGAHDLGVRYEAALAHAPLAQVHAGHADDVAAVLFTSGTESRSKGVVHSHNTILFGERALAGALGLGADDVAFMASPIAHATGFMHGVVMTLTNGATLSLLDVFDGAVALKQMRAHRCTWTMGATPFLVDTLAALRDTGGGLPDLRYFLCGGAPVPEVAVLTAGELGVRVMSIYGSTESPPHTLVHPDDPVANAWQTDGRALAGIETRIVGEDKQDVPVGEVGEEWSRGPNAFLGYFDEPELTRKDLGADGWYRSGDLARGLADGSIRIAGRIKDIIVRGGQNISVSEVENYLAGHPSVKSVAVVAVPHPRLGETGCAVVVAAPGHTPTLAELSAYLMDKGVARFKLPEQLEIWPSLPTTPSGKIQKFIVRQKLAEAGKGAPT